MARERIEDDRSTRIGSGTESMGRRRYLQLAGLGSATAVGVGAAGLVSATEYETITVDAGEHRVVSLNAGEALENTLIDVTASGASATVDAHASNTTIRNVGFEGRMDSPPTGIMGVTEPGDGTSVVENVYLGDGASAGHRHGLGLWVAPEHAGHLEIDRVNVQEMGDNSFYCSAPKGAGTVALKNCYSANSWVAHYRLAKGRVENCVALNDDRHKDGRGIWAWAPGPVEIRDCDLDVNGRHYAIAAGANGGQTHVEATNVRFDTDFHGGLQRRSGSTISIDGSDGEPDGSRVPDGCPTSAEEAASGADATEPDTPSDGSGSCSPFTCWVF
ncbi:hypothetical protein [Halovivax cerinus]|uniref:Right handed beta helix domain-containing protein n=1 Tax=Halovivax cerinus TaxID=1487865 RepID=A0ABD5NMT7_9EURY|nr:hypothetical protein [Halovivax cerinus]